MSRELRIGDHILPARSKQARHYVGAFTTGLRRIEESLAEQKAAGEAPYEGLAVLAVANRHYLGGHFPAELIQGFEPSSRQVDFVKACRTAEVSDGLTQIPKPEHKTLAGELGLQVHFNPLRALRPTGMARVVDVPIDRPFSTKDFNFQKTNKLETFLSDVLEGDLAGRPFSFLYNLVPFAVGHALLVPDIDAGLSQYIEDMQKLTMAWECLAKLASPSIWAGYNSLGAYASVPQYHWQIVCETTSWQPPIARYVDQAPNKDASPLRNWPISYSTVFRGKKRQVISDAFSLIDQLNSLAKANPNQYAYNIWLRISENGKAGDLVVLPRRHQSTQVDLLNSSQGRYTTGLAFFETGGNIIVPTEEAYRDVTEEVLLSYFEALSIPDLPQLLPTGHKIFPPGRRQ